MNTIIASKYAAQRGKPADPLLIFIILSIFMFVLFIVTAVSGMLLTDVLYPVPDGTQFIKDGVEYTVNGSGFGVAKTGRKLSSCEVNAIVNDFSGWFMLGMGLIADALIAGVVTIVILLLKIRKVVLKFKGVAFFLLPLALNAQMSDLDRFIDDKIVIDTANMKAYQWSQEDLAFQDTFQLKEFLTTTTLHDGTRKVLHGLKLKSIKAVAIYARAAGTWIDAVYLDKDKFYWKVTDWTINIYNSIRGFEDEILKVYIIYNYEL